MQPPAPRQHKLCPTADGCDKGSKCTLIGHKSVKWLLWKRNLRSHVPYFTLCRPQKRDSVEKKDMLMSPGREKMVFHNLHDFQSGILFRDRMESFWRVVGNEYICFCRACDVYVCLILPRFSLMILYPVNLLVFVNLDMSS
ncbi:hypothetical protein TNCT_605261 [Trichonephila clavata]|uniref:Uncharacterized protein n=1 Tax=Trichonephila clavata TaxID=2740835 RepID=A0A8X6LIR8_TRICU|nr:hypothetical protein TNCT_605261 [Trichonephila clavata]